MSANHSECTFEEYSRYHDAWIASYRFVRGEEMIDISATWPPWTTRDDRYGDAKRILDKEAPCSVIDGFRRTARRPGHSEGAGCFHLGAE